METSDSDRFVLDLESIKEDIKTMEKLHKRLQDTSEQIKTVHTAANMKQLQATMDSDIDHVFLVSKTIIERLQDLEASGPKSSNDQTSSTSVVVRGLGKKIKDMTDGFEGLRVKIVGLYKETIESIYYTVTKEKESVETIEKIISTGEIDTFLRVAAEEEGSVGILDVVQEIQERINNAKYMQKYLIELHHMFLDMVALVEAQRQKLSSDHKMGTAAVKGVGGGGDALIKDHVRMDPKKRATIAIIILVMFFILLVILIVSLIELESESVRQ